MLQATVKGLFDGSCVSWNSSIHETVLIWIVGRFVKAGLDAIGPLGPIEGSIGGVGCVRIGYLRRGAAVVRAVVRAVVHAHAHHVCAAAHAHHVSAAAHPHHVIHHHVVLRVHALVVGVVLAEAIKRLLLVSVSNDVCWEASWVAASSTATRGAITVTLLSVAAGGTTIPKDGVDCADSRIVPERFIKETERVIHLFSFDSRGRFDGNGSKSH